MSIKQIKIGSATHDIHSVYDGDGRNIKSTYMDLTSAQTASGVKTFTNGIKIGNAKLTYDTTKGALVISF